MKLDVLEQENKKKKKKKKKRKNVSPHLAVLRAYTARLLAREFRSPNSRLFQIISPDPITVQCVTFPTCLVMQGTLWINLGCS